MANLQASDSCLQTAWGAGQAKGSSLAAHGARKNGAGGKSAGKRLLKRAAKSSVDLDDYEEEQDHLDACFKDSDYGEHRGDLCSRGGLLPGPFHEMRFTDIKSHPLKGCSSVVLCVFEGVHPHRHLRGSPAHSRRQSRPPWPP